jgi:hypothetical protein
MTEPLFGSMAPIWAGSPTPAFGWTPAILGNRFPSSAGASLGYAQPPFANPFPVDPLGLGGPQGMAATNQPQGGGNFASGIAIAPSALATPPYPAFFGPDINATVTPSALLTTVALRRGQPAGPTNDQEIEEFIYDALDLLPGTNEIEVRSEAGRTTLTGSVQQKRLKRDAGEIAWAIPGITDVQNNVTIVARRRSRPAIREVETVAPGPVRK